MCRFEDKILFRLFRLRVDDSDRSKLPKLALNRKISYRRLPLRFTIHYIRLDVLQRMRQCALLGRAIHRAPEITASATIQFLMTDSPQVHDRDSHAPIRVEPVIRPQHPVANQGSPAWNRDGLNWNETNLDSVAE